MISVFTPSHNPRYLDAAYRSLQEQTYENWEWVVVLNNGAYWVQPDDPRVRVLFSEGKGGVGFYKAEAVKHCRYDILLELDHDDLLMPNALMDVAYVFDQNPGVGFVYSDFAQINEDGTPDMTEFSADHGWSYRFVEGYKVANSPAPNPHNVSYIWYAPNHLRAWRRTTYENAGGYNPDLNVLDDQDLMMRTYRVTEMHHIPELLYLQRVHPNNTQTVRNGEIQNGTVEMYWESVESNYLVWAKREGLRCLDLGAHHGKPEGYEGIDLRPGPGVDIVGDFMTVDIEPGSVGVIRAYDFLEHIPDKTAVVKRCYDLLAHGGVLLTMTPSTDGRGAFQDPTHVSFWNSNSWWYYTDANYAAFIDFDGRFQVSGIRNLFPTEWHQSHNIAYVQANLIALKGDGHDFGGHKNI